MTKICSITENFVVSDMYGTENKTKKTLGGNIGLTLTTDSNRQISIVYENGYFGIDNLNPPIIFSEKISTKVMLSAQEYMRKKCCSPNSLDLRNGYYRIPKFMLLREIYGKVHPDIFSYIFEFVD